MKIFKPAACVAAGVVLSVGLSVPAMASAGPVYTFAIEDLGQGAWGGGTLNADGSISGHGAFSFGNGSNVGSITGTTWSPAGPGFVSLCFTVTARKGQPIFPSGCMTAPITGTPIVISEGPGERTLLRVTPVS